jgi:hypothetical protein
VEPIRRAELMQRQLGPGLRGCRGEQGHVERPPGSLRIAPDILSSLAPNEF